MSDTYTVQIRFSGETLDPGGISEKLDLVPSHHSNQLQSAGGIRKRRPFWAYDGQGEKGFQVEWSSLAAGLKFLVESLEPKKAELAALALQFDGVWWCGHFQSSFDGGSTLSAELLTEIGSYGIPLVINNYFSND